MSISNQAQLESEKVKTMIEEQLERIACAIERIAFALEYKAEAKGEAKGEAKIEAKIEAKGEAKVTYNDLKTLCMNLVKKEKLNKFSMLDVLKPFNYETLSDVKEADFEALKKALEDIDRD